jgi:hypothetical protein
MQETVMSDEPGRRPGRRRPQRWVLGAGAATAAVVLAIAVVAGGRPVPPGVSPSPTAGTGTASCVESYSLATLADRAFAFDGTVSAIAGEKVTFTVNAPYRGVAGTTVTLEAPGMTGTAITSADGPTFAIGERYLVAGDASFAWGCGFTQPWDAAVAADWGRALGG